MGLKKLVLILGLLVSGGNSMVEPCEDFACDSLAVRAILDSNGLTNKDLKDLNYSVSDSGRIVKLSLNNLELTNLPPEIGKLNALDTLDLRHNKLMELPMEEIKALPALKKLKLDFKTEVFCCAIIDPM